MQEVVHALRELAACSHANPADLSSLLDALAAELLPLLCAATSSASGTAVMSMERCLGSVLRVSEGIQHAREMASRPGMGAQVKSMLTEPYLRKLASLPQKSTFDEAVVEEY
jgi:hypothetical protein